MAAATDVVGKATNKREIRCTVNTRIGRGTGRAGAMAGFSPGVVGRPPGACPARGVTGETMSTDETAPGDRADAVSDRERVLALLDDAIEEAHRKVTSGRVRDAENERVRCQWIRTLSYAVGQYRQLKADEDLEALDERVAQLEDARGGESAPVDARTGGAGSDLDDLLARLEGDSDGAAAEGEP